VQEERFPDALGLAIRALEPREIGSEFNPSLPGWISQIVAQALQSKRVRNRVFLSYSHKDKNWLEKFQSMLKPVLPNSILWDDSKIDLGSKWKDEIRESLASTKVAVLLVTKNFLASGFIQNNELPPLLQAAKEEGLKVLWVPLGFCMYQNTEIATYQAAHDQNRPLDSFKGAAQDKALAAVCAAIRSAVEDA
jgi:hypothetical protein